MNDIQSHLPVGAYERLIHRNLIPELNVRAYAEAYSKQPLDLLGELSTTSRYVFLLHRATGNFVGKVPSRINPCSDEHTTGGQPIESVNGCR